jgi:hypothetical protein
VLGSQRVGQRLGNDLDEGIEQALDAIATVDPHGERTSLQDWRPRCHEASGVRPEIAPSGRRFVRFRSARQATFSGRGDHPRHPSARPRDRVRGRPSQTGSRVGEVVFESP